MTASDFTVWLRGVLDAVDGALTPAQVEKIRERLAKVEAAPAKTEPSELEKLIDALKTWPQNPSQPPVYEPYYVEPWPKTPSPWYVEPYKIICTGDKVTLSDFTTCAQTPMLGQACTLEMTPSIAGLLDTVPKVVS